MMFPQATSHGNILTFTPPGFKQTLSVKYPDARLAVCDKCKKNFKTRDMCRVRNTHTAPPWTTAYVCITMDESCTDADGNFVDKPLTLRMVQWQPYAVKKTFSSKTPVCSACKRTNRTKNFCRERHKHRHLPWCTVYVLLSALDNADPHTVVAGASKPAPSSPEANGTQERPIKDEAPETAIKRTATDGTPPTDSSHSTLSPEVPEGEKKIPVVDDDSKSAIIATEPPGPGDNIHDIAESRTFLALVSSRNTSIHWLDLVEYEEAMPNFTQTPAAGVAPESPFPVAPQTPGDTPGGLPHHFYAPHAHAAYAQQHQSALKSQHQYFFHLQQQQPPQQQLRPGHPPAHPGYPQWQQFSPMEMPTAGEAAAAHRRGDEMAPHHAPMWSMYSYPHMYPMMPPPGTPGLMGHVPPHHHAHQHHHHAPNSRENGNGNAMGEPYTPQPTRTQQTEEEEEDDEEDGENNQDEEERDTKRLRTV